MMRIVLMLVFSCSFIISNAQSGLLGKRTVYEEVDLENLMKRYFGKSFGYSVEGMYSVSCVITKRTKKFLSNEDRVQVVARQDNYAKVAIMKDWPNSDRDFIEVSLSYKKTDCFPITGELNIVASGAGYLYTHFEPDGERITFSMLESDGLLEAEYSITEKKRTITYKLSYLKLYPTEKEPVTVSERR